MEDEVGQAGIIWYYDDDNYVKLVKERIGPRMTIVLAREEGGAAIAVA